MFITPLGYKALKRLVRKVFAVGTFNLPSVMKMWKDYINYVFIKLSESETLEKPSLESNIFGFLYPQIRLIVGDEDSRKQALEKLAHLISSRQLPTGDRKTESQALIKFRETVTSDYKPDAMILNDLYEASRIIGRRCRIAGPGPIRSAHLSMSCAGSFTNTILEGGRGQEIIDSITPILTVIPTEDCEHSLPFTVLKERKGVPRWRTWCRAEIYEEFPDVNFGDGTPDTIGGFCPFRQGFDESIGLQILACAYLSMIDDTQGVSEIPIRVLTIPEPGCKARIVTTGPYWLYVLQQSQAHVTRAFLASHPSAKSGLVRADQAWHYLYLISNARSSFKDDFACLSSDLESATDAIPRIVAKQLWKGFIDGLGYTGYLLDVAADLLIKDRLCLVETNDTFVATRGVFMGEPLTKTILTLLNLSCEEIAIREYLGYDYAKPVQVSWRCFAVAGDDHIAIGPMDYLHGITRTHIRAGSLISVTKHAVSKRFVRYCEKILDINNIRNLNWTPKTINNGLSEYNQSPFVDSIKVRLLSPCSKNNEKFNDRNTAVGKAKSLGRTLRWLNRNHFHRKWISMVRDRFFIRMGNLLPDRSSGVYWHLLLPEILGGLGLWLEEDIPDLTINLPEPTKLLLEELDTISAEKLTLFRGFTSNVSYRGYSLLESDLELAKEFLIPMVISGLGESKTLPELVQQFNLKDEAAGSQIKSLRFHDWLSEDDISDMILRPLLYKELLSGEAKALAYNTESFKRRYHKLWDLAFRGNLTISEDTVRKALAFKKRQLFYYIGEKFEIPIRGKLLSVNLIEEATIGLPNLKVQWTRVGRLARPIYDPDEPEDLFSNG
jgi:hypothetical protein